MMTCFMLVACATSTSKQSFNYQQGKSSFEAGDYKEAFHQLLPIAAQGKPDAQYAVGYMYYYGYGVSEDSESGIFWMTKSAEQNYPPAIKALQLIHQRPPEAESFVPVESRRGEQRQSVLLQKIREQHESSYVVTPKKMSYVEPEKKPPEPIVEEKQELKREYALQLYGSYHLDSVKDLQSQLRLKNTGHIYQTTHEGKDWYVLTFGNFVTAHEASATQKNLPDELKKMHPWVRYVNELRLADDITQKSKNSSIII